MFPWLKKIYSIPTPFPVRPYLGESYPTVPQNSLDWDSSSAGVHPCLYASTPLRLYANGE